jgi:hypothetical protein
MQRAVKMNMNSQKPENVTGAESAQTATSRPLMVASSILKLEACSAPTPPPLSMKHKRL